MALRKVVIVQRRLTHYRVPLFDGLRKALADEHIQLEVLVGSGTRDEDTKRDHGVLPWAIRLPTYYFAGGRLCWQPFREHVEDAKLVIIAQENRLLNNHLLLLRTRRFRLAFWGHGGNLQSLAASGVRERFKRWTTRQVDWWFAYTQLSASLVAGAGFPSERISVLNNAVDTSEMIRLRREISSAEILARRKELELGSGPVGIFIGSLHRDKRLDWLLAAAQVVNKQIPDFRLLLVGDGPERGKVRAWTAAHPWARWIGARRERDKVAYARTAQVMLNPGLVGLGLLDAFALGVPMITTAWPYHSPEIAYLEHDKNGIVAADDVHAFSDTVVALLRDAGRLDRLREGCAASAAKYSIEDMTERFAGGIEAALQASWQQHSRE